MVQAKNHLRVVDIRYLRRLFNRRRRGCKTDQQAKIRRNGHEAENARTCVNPWPRDGYRAALSVRHRLNNANKREVHKGVTSAGSGEVAQQRQEHLLFRRIKRIVSPRVQPAWRRGISGHRKSVGGQKTVVYHSSSGAGAGFGPCNWVWGSGTQTTGRGGLTVGWTNEQVWLRAGLVCRRGCDGPEDGAASRQAGFTTSRATPNFRKSAARLCLRRKDSQELPRLGSPSPAGAFVSTQIRKGRPADCSSRPFRPAFVQPPAGLKL